MQIQQFPRAKYALPVLASVTPKGVAMWAAEQAASQEAWWGQVPWGWLSLIGLAWFSGTLYADIWNRDSQLRDWIKWKLRIGEFSSPRIRHDWISLGETYGGNQKFYIVYLTFTPRWRINLERICVLARRYRYLGGRVSGSENKYRWSQAGRRLVSAEEFEIPLAFIPESFGSPGVYGDRSLGGYMLGAHSAHFLTVRLLTRFREQRTEIQIFLPSDRVSFNPPAAYETAGRFFVFDNRELPSEVHNGSR